jgi:acetoin utilization protein AcuB
MINDLVGSESRAGTVRRRNGEAMFVEDYMTPDPYTVLPDRTLSTAYALMHKHRIRHVPVVDAAGRLAGIITDRDVRTAVGFDATLVDKLSVSEVMTPDPMTIPANAPLDRAVAILSSRRFGALPVLRNKLLVGIVTYIDVLRAFCEIFGLDEPGKRIDVALPEGYADIARAFEVLRGCDGTVISAVISRSRRDGGEPYLYLRVVPEAAARVEQRLRSATMILLRPEQ